MNAKLVHRSRPTHPPCPITPYIAYPVVSKIASLAQSPMKRPPGSDTKDPEWAPTFPSCPVTIYIKDTALLVQLTLPIFLISSWKANNHPSLSQTSKDYALWRLSHHILTKKLLIGAESQKDIGIIKDSPPTKTIAAVIQKLPYSQSTPVLKTAISTIAGV